MTPYVRPDHALTRRRLLASAGLAATTVGVLGACGGGGDGGGASGGGQAPPSAGSAGPLKVKSSEIPVGGGKVFTSEQAVVTQPKAGEFKAFSSVCTHAGCPVADVTQTINCNCHGSKFSITDGSVVNGPATQPLATRPVQVAGGSVSVS